MDEQVAEKQRKKYRKRKSSSWTELYKYMVWKEK